MKMALPAAVLALLFSAAADARGSHSGSHSGGHSHSSGSHHSSGTNSAHRSSGGSHSAHHGSSSGNHHKAAGVQRDSHGRIKRSAKVKDDFKRSNPCPSTGKSSGACPGYVADHRTALKHGGVDDPSNMQWQTKQAAKEKDKWE